MSAILSRLQCVNMQEQIQLGWSVVMGAYAPGSLHHQVISSHIDCQILDRSLLTWEKKSYQPVLLSDPPLAPSRGLTPPPGYKLTGPCWHSPRSGPHRPTEGTGAQGLMCRCLTAALPCHCIGGTKGWTQLELGGQAAQQGPVLLTLLRHVARILANGRAAFFESCDAIGWNSCDVSQKR